jgi:hypothetical protein
VTLRPDSNETFHVVYSWLDQCLNSHGDCSSVSHSNLPARVIDIGPEDGSQEPYLLIPGEKWQPGDPQLHIRYVALSYCWGYKIQPFTTTSANLEEHKSRIAMSQFPRTLQDAIIISRQLRIHYLWIDGSMYYVFCKVLTKRQPLTGSESRHEWRKSMAAHSLQLQRQAQVVSIRVYLSKEKVRCFLV